MNRVDHPALRIPAPGRLPPFRMLATFEALARLGSRQAAADELNVTLGAVGKQLRALEQWAGVPLFQGPARDLALTSAGRLLAQSVTAGMQVMLAGIGQIRPSGVPSAAQLRLIVPASLAMSWLVPRLPMLELAEPRLRVTVMGSHTGDDWLALPHDAAIRRDGFLPPGYASEYLLCERLCAFVAPRLAGTAASPDAMPLLESITRVGDLDRWLAAAGVQRLGVPRRQFSHFYVALEAAIAGEGLLVAPWLLASAAVEVGRVRPVWPEVSVSGAVHSLVYPRGSERLPAIARFAEWLRAELGRMPLGSVAEQER